jgi:uncharacterized membrane protein YfhO
MAFFTTQLFMPTAGIVVELIFICLIIIHLVNVRLHSKYMTFKFILNREDKNVLGIEDDRNIVSKKCLVLILLASFGITLGILLCSMYIYKIAPFGNQSFVFGDGYNQYIDFFNFFKDVLMGNNSLSYTFSNNLGGSYVGQFAYYVSSPFSLLVVFFPKDQVYDFFDVVVALKISLASATFAYFLSKRFKGKLYPGMALLFSLAYGFMSYNLHQINSIMWLDGVYMLPFMLLGVYQVIRNRKITLLAVSTSLSIIFNWYTGGINCIFVCFWLVLEWYLQFGTFSNFFKDKQILIRFMLAMSLGVLISMVLFLPAILQLRSGVGNSFDWNHFSLGKRGSIGLSLGGFYLGNFSTAEKVALFTGSLSVLGIIQLLFTAGRKMRIAAFMSLFFLVLLFHWKPFYFLFSLFKDATSFYIRYSYTGAAILLFLGALYFSHWLEQAYTKKNLLIGFLPPLFLLFMHMIKPGEHLDYVYGTATFLAVFNVVLYLIRTTGKRKILFGLLGILVLCEMGTQASLFLKDIHSPSKVAYSQYELAEENMIHELQIQDSSQYRISQTSNRQTVQKITTTPVYNEAVGFNYWGIGGYTSVPSNRQMKLLDNLGYREEHMRMNVINMPVLPADSFLGVKYILSHYPVEGLKEDKIIPAANYKKVYQNPYALPMAFVCQPDESEITGSNPFLYTNSLYSHLIGKKVSIYQPIVYQARPSENGVIYTLEGYASEEPLYGNITSNQKLKGKIKAGEFYEIPYSDWTTQSVFYIPKKATKAPKITLTTSKPQAIQEAQFYEVNLDALKAVTSEMQKREATHLAIENGNIYGYVQGRKGESLFLLVPVDKGWKILRNGKEVSPVPFADCFITIPLVDGVNEISMTYHLPGFWLGIGLSLLGIVLLIGFCRYAQKSKRNMNTTTL